MCSPGIVQHAHDAAVAAPRPSRRALLGAAGLTALAGMSATARPARAFADTRGPVYDLTHVLSPRLPLWPGNPPMSMARVAWYEAGGFEQQAVGFWEHTGTHLDAPAHRIPGGATTESLAARDLVAPLVVIDIAAKAAGDADAVLTVADVKDWQSRHGAIPRRAFVALHSGWEQRIADPQAFVNLDAHGVPHEPGFSPEAAHYLIEQCDVVGIGVDTLSLDHASSRDAPTHSVVLGAGRYGVEMLANLATVPPSGTTAVVGAPKHAGGTGGPCRVLALA